jgi:ribosomal-protein-alanine N-acetyltransferase
MMPSVRHGPRLPLATKRLRIREFAPGDEEALAALYADRRVTRHLLHGPRDAESVQRHLAGILRRQRGRRRDTWELGAVDAASGLLVGAADLALHSSAEAEIGYLVAHSRWGRGYGTEIAAALVESAFEDLGVAQVVATVDIGNARSVGVLDKVGLRWEATFRRHARDRQRQWDVHLYSLDREDWLQAQGRT